MARQPSDSALRQAAIDPSRSFIVQAPAGSGKTELLTDRILALLATVNRPEEIVAITFTRKAASEMHARVLAKLAAGKGPCPEEAYRRRSWELARDAMHRNEALGWNLLEYPARLSIRTIDSFCAHLVRAMPWTSSLGGMPSITDDARRHYEAAAAATLAMADDDASVARLLAHLDVDARAARDLLADMLSHREQWLPLLGPGSDVQRLLQNLDRAVQTDLERLAAAMPPGWADALAPCLSQAVARLAAGGEPFGLSALQDWDGRPPGTDADCVAKWQALADALLTAGGTLRRTVTIKQGFEAKSQYKEDFLAWLKAVPDSEPWIALLADVRHVPRGGYDAAQRETLRVLTDVLWLAAAQLKLQFTDAAEVDFSEISQRALQALGDADDPTDLLLSLDAGIRHILVDEFQDTSQPQIQLLERLTSGWLPGDGRSVFLVGDPMQSIYRFRKAEVGWFLKVKHEGLGQLSLTALELTDNFRSQGGLVQWINDTCRPIFPKENHLGLGAITYTPSVAFRDAESGMGVRFHPVWRGLMDDDDDDVRAASEETAVRLATEALRQHAGSAHPVAILVRARSHLDGIVHRLAQQGVPCRAVELVTLASRQVVIDLAQLARALAHPGDRLAWLSVLRSPLCGLTLAGLHGVFGTDLHAAVPALLRDWVQGRRAAQLEPDDAARLRHAAAILLDDANLAGTVPFAAWLETCWRRLGGPSIYSTDSDRADAERLFRLIEQLAPYGNLDPAQLEERLAELYAAPNSSGAAVEVMTIHKSKGLEFDTVILTGLHKSPMSDRPPLMRFEQTEGELLLGPIRHRASEDTDPVSAYLAQREKKRAAYEADRLLYVALTRARKQLHLVGTVSLEDGAGVKRPTAGSLLGRLWDHLTVPEAPPPRDAVPNPLDAVAKGQRYLWRVPAAALPALPLPVVQSRDADVRAGGAASWRWRSGSDDDSLIGTAAHAWLERIGKDGAAAWSEDRIAGSTEVFRRQLSRAGLAPADLDQGVEVLRRTLIATVASERGRWLLWAARAHREWSLLDLSGRVSVIDLAISQESDWLVVDYKTGAPQPGESLQAFETRMRERYRAQLERYCAHVSALDGRPARGALYFPRADLWIDYAPSALAEQAEPANSC